jgi:hypothetical protein
MNVTQDDIRMLAQASYIEDIELLEKVLTISNKTIILPVVYGAGNHVMNLKIKMNDSIRRQMKAVLKRDLKESAKILGIVPQSGLTLNICTKERSHYDDPERLCVNCPGIKNWLRATNECS